MDSFFLSINPLVLYLLRFLDCSWILKKFLNLVISCFLYLTFTPFFGGESFFLFRFFFEFFFSSNFLGMVEYVICWICEGVF